jgi:chromosome segregation ATPase
MRHADVAYGHQLQQTKDKMTRLKKDCKAKVERLVVDKRALGAEVKKVLQEAKEGRQVTTIAHKEHVRQLSLKVKAVKKLSCAEIKAATEKHITEVANLEREKDGLRLHVTRQRRENKERVNFLEGKQKALELRCIGSELHSKKLVREVQAQEARGRNLENRTAKLEEEVAEKEDEKNKLCDDITIVRQTFGTTENELGQLRLELRSKSEELEKLRTRFRIWKQAEAKKLRVTKKKIAALTTERDDLRNVRLVHNVICVLCFLCCVSFISN